MNKLLLNAITVFLGSIAVFIVNIQSVLVGQPQPIPYDYMVLASFFFCLIALRDDLSKNAERRAYSILIACTLMTMIFSLMALGIFRSVNLFSPKFEQLSTLAIVLFIGSVFQLLSRDFPSELVQSIVSTDYLFYGGLTNTLLHSLPAAVLTFILYKVAQYPASVANHASVFAALLALILLFREGIRKKKRKAG